MKLLKPLPRKKKNVLSAAHEAVPPAAALSRSKSNRVQDISLTNLAEDPKLVEEKKEDDKPAEEEKKDDTKPAEEANAGEQKTDTAQRKSQQYTAARTLIRTWPSDDQMRTFQQCALSCKEQQVALHVEVAELKRFGLINKEEERQLYGLIHQRNPDIIRVLLENAGKEEQRQQGEEGDQGEETESCLGEALSNCTCGRCQTLSVLAEKEKLNATQELKVNKLKVALEKHSATAPAADVKPFLSYRLQFKRTIKRSSAHILQVPAPATVKKDVFEENIFNVHLVRYFVENVWKLDRPNVIISITGGALNFDLPPEHKDRMMRGMMEGTRQMKPWFITGGANAGIMKHVGEARVKYNPSAPLIGVTMLPGLAGGVQLRRMFQEAKTEQVAEIQREVRKPTLKEILEPFPAVKEILDRCTTLKEDYEGSSFVSKFLRNLRCMCKQTIEFPCFFYNDWSMSILTACMHPGCNGANVGDEPAVKDLKLPTYKPQHPQNDNAVSKLQHSQNDLNPDEIQDLSGACFQQDLSGAWIHFKRSGKEKLLGASEISYEDLKDMSEEAGTNGEKPDALDPNHSHFILLDDGETYVQAKDAFASGMDRHFRAAFEACVARSPHGRYPIYQLQNLPNDETLSNDETLPNKVTNGHRVLSVTVTSARSALQAIFLKCHGWVVDEELAKEEHVKKQICNTHGKYWCEDKEMADWTWDEKTGKCEEKTERSVGSALQSIWLHAGTGSANQRFKELFGLKWKEAGSEKPSTRTEIKTTFATTTHPAATDSFGNLIKWRGGGGNWPAKNPETEGRMASNEAFVSFQGCSTTRAEIFKKIFHPQKLLLKRTTAEEMLQDYLTKKANVKNSKSKTGHYNDQHAKLQHLELQRQEERQVIVTVADDRSGEMCASTLCQLKNLGRISACDVQRRLGLCEKLHKAKEPQLRVDPDDAKAYPLNSFLKRYGEAEGQRRWANASHKIAERYIPLVSVCVQGGPWTVDTVLQACKSGTPTLLVRGSGKAADLLSDAVSLQYSPSHRAHVRSLNTQQLAFWKFFRLCGVGPRENDETDHKYDWEKAIRYIQVGLKFCEHWEEAITKNKPFYVSETFSEFFDNASELVTTTYKVKEKEKQRIVEYTTDGWVDTYDNPTLVQRQAPSERARNAQRGKAAGEQGTEDSEAAAQIKEYQDCLVIIKDSLEVALTQKCWVYDLLSTVPGSDDFNGALLKCLLNGIAPVGHESADVLKEKLKLSMLWSSDDYTDYLLESMSLSIDDKQREEIFNDALLSALKNSRVRALARLLHRDTGLKMLDVGNQFCHVTHFYNEDAGDAAKSSKEDSEDSKDQQSYFDAASKWTELIDDAITKPQHYFAEIFEWRNKNLCAPHHFMKIHPKTREDFIQKLKKKYHKDCYSQVGQPIPDGLRLEVYKSLKEREKKLEKEKEGDKLKREKPSQKLQKCRNMMNLVTLEEVYMHFCSKAFRYRLGILGPVFDLFYWNVLQNERDLAFEMWKHVAYPVRSAICASYMLRKMAKYKNTEPAARDKMLENAAFFEEQATLVLQAAEEDDRELAASSLDCGLYLWRGMSLMDVALECKCFRVLETGCFKKAINSRLYGDLSPYGNETFWGQLKLMFFTLTFGFFPAFIPHIFTSALYTSRTIRWAPPPDSQGMRRSTQRRVTPEGYPHSPSQNSTLRKLKDEYRKRRRKKDTLADLLDKPDDQVKYFTKRELEDLWEPTFGILDKVGCFMSAPYVLFVLNGFMTIITTLGFTVWFWQIKLDPSNSVDIHDNMTVAEIILMVYFGGCLVREVSQFCMLKLQYFYDGWNIPEILSLATFFVAFGLRNACTQSSECNTFSSFNTITTHSFLYSLSLFFCWVSMLRIFCLSKLGITIGIFFSMMTSTLRFWVLYFILLLALSMLFIGTSDLDTLIPGHATCGNSTNLAKGDLPDDELPENGFMECAWTYVILRPMFQSFGEFGSFFPQMTNSFNIVFLIFTYFSLNLVGLNLLIAMTSSIYASVSKRAERQSWVYTYAMVQEYTARSIASPPPVNVILLMLDLILFFWHYKRIWNIYPDYTWGQRLERFLTRNEDIAKAERARGAMTNSNNQSPEDRRLQDKISAFMEHARRSVMNKQHSKDSIDGKLDSITSEIKHMQGMQEAICLQGKGKAAGVKEEASTDFKGEEWKRGKEARERENDKLKASLAPQSRKDLVKRVAEVLHLFEHTDNQKQENYNFIASLAPLSRKDLIERVVEVLDTQRYLENKQDKVSRYLRDELYAKRKDEVSGDEISDPRKTGGEVVEHGCASKKLKDEDLQAVKNDLKLNLADKYLQMLESEDINVRTLLETLEVGGRQALLQLLEDAGVDKAGARARVANCLQQIVDKHSELIQ